jgi:hypothetical protein
MIETQEVSAQKQKRADQCREDREYQQYGRHVAELLRAIGRGNRYRIRKYRRNNSVIGWLLQQEPVRTWLEGWHVDPSWVIGITTTVHRRDSKVMQTVTTIRCCHPGGQSTPQEWSVVVPVLMPEMVHRIPKELQ